MIQFHLVDQLIKGLVSDEINENNSISLSFIFPDVYLNCIKFINDGKVRVFEHEGKQVIWQVNDVYCDWNSWYCTCDDYKHHKVSLDQDHDSNFSISQNVKRFNKKIPICQHMLTIWICNQNTSNIDIKSSFLSFNEFIELNKEIV